MKMKLSILRSSKSFSLLNFEKVSNIFFNCKNYLLLTLWFASSNYAVSHFFNSRFFWMFAVKKNKPFQLNSTSIYAALFSISSINSIYDEIKKKKEKKIWLENFTHVRSLRNRYFGWFFDTSCTLNLPRVPGNPFEELREEHPLRIDCHCGCCIRNTWLLHLKSDEKNMK